MYKVAIGWCNAESKHPQAEGSSQQESSLFDSSGRVPICIKFKLQVKSQADMTLPTPSFQSRVFSNCRLSSQGVASNVTKPEWVWGGD